MSKLIDKRTCAAGFFAGFGTLFGTAVTVWVSPFLGLLLGLLWIVAGLLGLFLHELDLNQGRRA